MTSKNRPAIDKKKKRNNDRLEIVKKEVLAYKYSQKGQGTLYEAIILKGEPRFVTCTQTSELIMKVSRRFH